MLTEHRFHTGVVTLNYAEGAASGPPLVLLHGGSSRWQSSLPLIPDLSQHWHVYAPDLRGHGQSGHVPGSYRLKDYVADIVSFLEKVVQEPAILFGHSLGGQIAILIAAWYPHLVKALLIGDAPLDYMNLRTTLQQDQQRLVYWRDLAASPLSLEEISEKLKLTPITIEGQPVPVAASVLFGEEHPWFRDMAENLHLLDPDMLDAVIEFDQMHVGYDYDRLFPLITCAVLIIQGSPAHGGMLTNVEVEHALTLLAHGSVARMETVGHPLHTQEKAPVLLAITAFLNML